MQPSPPPSLSARAEAASSDALPALSKLRREPWLKRSSWFFVASGAGFVLFALAQGGDLKPYLLFSGAFMAVSGLADALNLGRRWTVMLIGVSMLLFALSFVAFLRMR